MNHIFVDGSYFIFYRYHALKVWWKNAKKEHLEDPYENEEFLEKFKTTFKSKLEEIPKKLKVNDYKNNNYKFYIGKDCPRQEIWRMELYPEYKSNRVGEEGSSTEKEGKIIKKFFKLVYENNMFDCIDGLMLSIPKLEADDCLSLYSQKVYKDNKNDNIYIITSDVDYLQLLNDRIHIYDLKYKEVKNSRNCFNDKYKNLFFKIVMGDKSDNIPPIFKRCGLKTVEKYFQDKDLFSKKLDEDPQYRKNLLLNTRLVSFACIPICLKNDFYTKYFKKLF